MLNHITTHPIDCVKVLKAKISHVENKKMKFTKSADTDVHLLDNNLPSFILNIILLLTIYAHV